MRYKHVCRCEWRIVPAARTSNSGGIAAVSLSPAAPFAVARNEEVVPRGTYEECDIHPGDSIDIVHPTAGG